MKGHRSPGALILPLVAGLALAACGGSSKPAATPAPTKAAATPTASATSAKVPIAPQDQAACAALYARLQRVTVAVGSASELIASSVNPKDLSAKIKTEQTQFERSAALMDSAVVPKPLVSANRTLVAALKQYARGFAKAKAPALRGDFQAAVQAMTDQSAVNAIVASAKTIEDSCAP
jgi:transglutaminase/protease-like cytokinesis protein 3